MSYWAKSEDATRIQANMIHHREHHTHIMWVLWYETHTTEDQYGGKIYTSNATVFAEIFYNLYKISLSGSGIQYINSGYFQSWSSIKAYKD